MSRSVPFPCPSTPAPRAPAGENVRSSWALSMVTTVTLAPVMMTLAPVTPAPATFEFPITLAPAMFEIPATLALGLGDGDWARRPAKAAVNARSSAPATAQLGAADRAGRTFAREAA